MIVKNNEKLNTIQGNNCFISNLVSISNYMGLGVSEESIYTSIGHRYSFGNWINPENRQSYPTLLCFDADIGKDLIVSEFYGMGLFLEQNVFDSNEDVLRYIMHRLKFNIPVIVNVNSYYLNYWPENIRDYYAHYIILYGVDENQKFVHIIDNYIPSTPVQCYKGRLSFDLFMKALDFSNIRINHKKKIVWSLSCNRKMREMKADKDDEIIKKFINNTYNNMKLNVKESSTNIGCYYYKCFSGIQALASFKIFLNQMIKQENYNGDILMELYKNITSFGGPVGTLGLVKKFFDKYMGESSNCNEMTRVRDNIINIIDCWKRIGICLFRFNITNSPKNIQKAITQLEDIQKTEVENINLYRKINLESS